MSDPVAVYLHDYLVESTFAVELIEAFRQRYSQHETGSIATEQVRKDRQVLESIIQRVGTTHKALKDAAAWLAEKASRAKLQHDDPVGLGAFEALEALGLRLTGEVCGGRCPRSPTTIIVSSARILMVWRKCAGPVSATGEVPSADGGVRARQETPMTMLGR